MNRNLFKLYKIFRVKHLAHEMSYAGKIYRNGIHYISCSVKSVHFNPIRGLLQFLGYRVSENLS